MADVKLKNKEVEQGFLAVSPPTTTKRKKGRDSASEYKKSLQEKQTLKKIYGLSEKQFKKYVKTTLAMTKRENMSDELIKLLEKRLDNVIFRLGFAISRAQSRQLVTHAYFLVNGKPVNIPSFQVKNGDVISIKEAKKKKLIFKDLPETLKKIQIPAWLSFDKEKLEGKIVSYPDLSQVNPPVQIPLIFELYSR